jgi:hypothetical protein
MIVQCCKCREIEGEKEPLDNKAISHGICLKCMPSFFEDAGLSARQAIIETDKIRESCEITRR